jgi:hypothetical protein
LRMNSCCASSIITLEVRQIARWRDYMDSHAAWKAMTAAA